MLQAKMNEEKQLKAALLAAEGPAPGEALHAKTGKEAKAAARQADHLARVAAAEERQKLHGVGLPGKRENTAGGGGGGSRGAGGGETDDETERRGFGDDATRSQDSGVVFTVKTLGSEEKGPGEARKASGGPGAAMGAAPTGGLPLEGRPNEDADAAWRRKVFDRREGTGGAEASLRGGTGGAEASLRRRSGLDDDGEAFPALSAHLEHGGLEHGGHEHGHRDVIREVQRDGVDGQREGVAGTVLHGRGGGGGGGGAGQSRLERENARGSGDAHLAGGASGERLWRLRLANGGKDPVGLGGSAGGYDSGEGGEGGEGGKEGGGSGGGGGGSVRKQYFPDGGDDEVRTGRATSLDAATAARPAARPGDGGRVEARGTARTPSRRGAGAATGAASRSPAAEYAAEGYATKGSTEGYTEGFADDSVRLARAGAALRGYDATEHPANAGSSPWSRSHEDREAKRLARVARRAAESERAAEKLRAWAATIARADWGGDGAAPPPPLPTEPPTEESTLPGTPANPGRNGGF